MCGFTSCFSFTCCFFSTWTLSVWFGAATVEVNSVFICCQITTSIISRDFKDAVQFQPSTIKLSDQIRSIQIQMRPLWCQLNQKVVSDQVVWCNTPSFCFLVEQFWLLMEYMWLHKAQTKYPCRMMLPWLLNKSRHQVSSLEPVTSSLCFTWRKDIKCSALTDLHVFK